LVETLKTRRALFRRPSSRSTLVRLLVAILPSYSNDITPTSEV